MDGACQIYVIVNFFMSQFLYVEFNWFLRNKKRDYKKKEVIAILVEWTAMGEKEGGGGGLFKSVVNI